MRNAMLPAAVLATLLLAAPAATATSAEAALVLLPGGSSSPCTQQPYYDEIVCRVKRAVRELIAVHVVLAEPLAPAGLAP